MTTKPTAKLCWNCEGKVSFKADNCPFCGVYLSPSQDDQFDEEPSADSSPYAPPYQLPANRDEPPPQVAAKISAAPELGEENLSSEMKLVLLTLGLLSAGALFLLFGFVLLLFAKEGHFTLQWNASYWYVYLLVGVLMLFFGWRALEKFGDDQ